MPNPHTPDGRGGVDAGREGGWAAGGGGVPRAPQLLEAAVERGGNNSKRLMDFYLKSGSRHVQILDMTVLLCSKSFIIGTVGSCLRRMHVCIAQL